MAANDELQRVSQPSSADGNKLDEQKLVDHALFDALFERYKLQRAVQQQDASGIVLAATAAMGLVLASLCARLNRVLASDVDPDERARLDGTYQSRDALIDELDQLLPQLPESPLQEVLTRVRSALCLAGHWPSSSPQLLKAESL